MSGGSGSAVECEVAIVGAGPAGLLLAAELGRAGVDVALLERRDDRTARSRAVGVHPTTLARLEESGAAERILSGACRITRGQVRDGKRVLGEIRFDRLNTRFPCVAAVPQAVTEHAVALGGAPARRGIEVRRVRDRGTYVEVEYRAGETLGELRARIVVVAAGTRGAELVAGAELVTRDYPDRYVMADLPGDPSAAAQLSASADGDRAVIVLHRLGVVESFPLPGGSRRLVAWDGNADRRDNRRYGAAAPAPAAPTPTPTPAVTAATAERLRRAVRERAAEPELAARIQHATSFAVHRAVLRRLHFGRILVIGDSAHEVSPIGGQGMNLGLLDAVTLAPLITAWISAGAPPDSLAAWEQRRLRSARIAARIAGVNTRLGRPKPPLRHRLTVAAAGVTAAGRSGQQLARVYGMGLDRDAAPPHQ